MVLDTISSRANRVEDGFSLAQTSAVFNEWHFVSAAMPTEQRQGNKKGVQAKIRDKRAA